MPTLINIGPDPDVVQIYCDGSCRDGQMGAGIYINTKPSVKISVLLVGRGNSQMAEMGAMLIAFEESFSYKRAVVHCDDQMTLKRVK